MRDYELMYIVRPELDEDGVRGAVQSVRTLIEGQGGEVVKTTLWGKRRLAYDVQRLHDGHYVLVALRLDGARVGTVERALRIHDTVFRHLLVVHQGPMPEPDGDIVEVAPDQAPPEAPTGAAAVADNVAAVSGDDGDDEVEDEELAEAPSASDDEGDV